jgi:hypothetical protein
MPDTIGSLATVNLSDALRPRRETRRMPKKSNEVSMEEDAARPALLLEVGGSLT